MTTEINMLEQKSFVFDPLSTIIKLAVLGHKPMKSKISLKDNIITIQVSGVMQSISRYYSGDTKTDIHYLSLPIELACKEYLTLKHLNRNPDIVKLFKCAQTGLTNLMETYRTYPIIVHCLKYYFSIIETYLNELLSEKNAIVITDKSVKNTSIKSSPININKPVAEHNIVIKDMSPTVSAIAQNRKKKHSNISTPENDQFITPVNSPNLLSTSKDTTLDSALENFKLDESTEKNKLTNPANTANTANIANPTDPTNTANPTDPTELTDELLKLYSNELLEKLNKRWDNEKIDILIDMIKFLLTRDTSIEYSDSIETFMIPIDKKTVEIIKESNQTR